MREITRSVKVALKCLIAVVLVDVDLPYWTSKVEDLIAFAAIFSNICTAHAQKRLFMHFRCKVRKRRSIRRPWVPIWVQNFGDLATFYVDFCIVPMSAIFLLPVCLTYCSRKYITRVDPHVDNFHKVWSWYDHTLPSYSVFVCWYITWLCDLDFWPFDLEQLLFMKSNVSNLPTKFEDPTLIRSSVMSYNFFRWLPLKMRTLLLRMRQITWPVSKGSKTITYLESPTPISLFTMQHLLGYDDVYSQAVQC